jgi:TonB-dependent receptor
MIEKLMRGAAWAPLVLALAAGAAAADPLTGRVTDAGGTRSLQGALVRVVELGRTSEVGRDGLYRFDLPAGSYTLEVTYVGAATEVRRVQVSGATNADFGLNAVATSGDVTVVEPITVIGQRASLQSSLSRQRSADGVESVLTRDDIGQFPDQNVAEAVRRLPGVNVLNDQGEGRFIAVRGLDPNLNSASINGVRVPAPESDVRSVALDVIPSELIESIEIKKTLTPDMDGDTIGGSIEINTTSGFDRRRPLTSVKVEGSYNDLSGEWSPKASLDFSRNYGDWGVAGGLSYYRRQFETDNVETGGWDEAGGVAFAPEVEYRDYDVERERLGATLSFDWRANADTSLYTRLLFAQFDDQEYRRRLIFDLEDATPRSGTADTAVINSADGERFTVIRDIKDRFESQEIRSIVVGGRTDMDAWRFDYSLSYAEASETENGSIDPARFRQRFSGAGGSQGEVRFDYSDIGRPQYDVTIGEARFLDPTRYAFYRLERTTLSDAQDEELSARFDARRTFDLDGGSFDVQFGGKARQREKTYDLTLDYYETGPAGFTLANVVGESTYRIADIDPAIGDANFRDFFEANPSGFTRSAIDTTIESNIADYGAKEDIYAGYLLGRWETQSLRVVGGVRYEQTETDLIGKVTQLVAAGDTYNGVVVPVDTVFVTPTRFERDYGDWLPSVAFRYEASDEVVVRGGVFRALVRPTFGRLAPRYVVNEDNEGEFGNPLLDPYDAWNYDLTAEWYFAPNAVLQAGVFYKDIQDFIVDVEFDDVPYPGGIADTAVIAVNGEEATVFGVELGYSQALTFLPGPFDGLLVGLNYTYTDAEGVAEGRTVPLPASSENTVNLTVGYENGPLSLRLAGSYRDLYLDELGGSAEEDRYVADHLQWDFSGKYDVTDAIQVFAEFVNLTDEPYLAYQRGPGRNRLLQFEEYSFTGKAGLRFRF